MPSSSMSSENLTKLWKSVLGRLEIEMSKPNYRTFLEETKAISFQKNKLQVEAPSIFICDHLNNRLNVIITHALASITSQNIEILFIPKGDNANNPEDTKVGGLVGRIQTKLTLKNYITTIGNQRSLSICRNIIDEVSGAISPVVVHGDSGYGKTHLLNAIANEAIFRGWDVGIFTAEEFTTCFMEAVRESKLANFQKQLRSRRLLIIDNFEELAGKVGTQREILHTLDVINSKDGHFIVGYTGHLQTFAISESLKSRLEAGIVVEIQPPVGEEQRSFIHDRSKTLKTALPNWAVDQIIKENFKNIRALQAIVHGAIILEREHTLGPEQLKAMLVSNIATKTNHKSANLDLRTITQSFGLTEEVIKGRGRSKQEIQARAVVAASLRRNGSSYGAIAALLGGRDRSTIRGLVLHGETLAENDNTVAEILIRS